MPHVMHGAGISRRRARLCGMTAMPVAGVPALALEEERRLVIDLLCSLMDLGRIEPCIPYLPTENRSGCAAYLSAPVSPALSLLECKISVASFLLKQLERAVNPARQVRALGQKWESRHEQCSAHQVVARAEVIWAARAEDWRSEAARAEADCRSELARSELAQAAATRAAATARAVACFVPTGASSSGCVPLEMRCALVRDQRVLDHLIYPIRLYGKAVCIATFVTMRHVCSPLSVRVGIHRRRERDE